MNCPKCKTKLKKRTDWVFIIFNIVVLAVLIAAIATAAAVVVVAIAAIAAAAAAIVDYTYLYCPKCKKVIEVN